MAKDRLTFGQKVNKFNSGLEFKDSLPAGIEIMNPFRENSCATPASIKFYDKFYGDYNKRGIILGINPGRFGAGITGVPFTDPIHLADDCDIHIETCPKAREPSSEFIYEVIDAYGGVEKFYSRWYINSVCPLGFTKTTAAGKAVNYNYYDNKSLETAALPFILQTLPQQIEFGIYTAACFCLGMDKNARFLRKLNQEHKFFGEIAPLEHPRYIMQYKTAEKGKYIAKYVSLFQEWEKKFVCEN